MIIEIRDDLNQYLFSNTGTGIEKQYNDLILTAKPRSSYKLKKYFFHSDLKVEAFKNLDSISYRNNPRVKYEMLNPWINEKFNDSFDNYDDEELLSFMNKDELKAFNSLPFCFIAYRGFSTNEFDINKAKNAMSWTVDKRVAKRFIDFHNKNNNKKKYLIEKLIFKSDVKLVLLARNEAEIVIDNGGY